MDNPSLKQIAYQASRSWYDVAVVQYSPGASMPAHAHGFASMGVVLAGSLIEDVGATRVEARAGSMVLKPAGTLHANRFGATGARLLAVTLDHSHDIVTNWKFDHWCWKRALDPYRDALRVVGALVSEAHSRTPMVDDVGDILTDLIASLTEPRRLSPGNRKGRWLKDVVSALDESGEHRPRVAELARLANVHPVYLARAFRGAYGVSIANYRRRQRVLAALPSITESQSTLSRVAATHGFADHAHLTRECTDLVGAPPSRIRRLALE
ncbi:MAG: helix-turn-helix domain-containing protein [Gemmatimonadaceae bacterium]